MEDEFYDAYDKEDIRAIVRESMAPAQDSPTAHAPDLRVVSVLALHLKEACVSLRFAPALSLNLKNFRLSHEFNPLTSLSVSTLCLDRMRLAHNQDTLIELTSTRFPTALTLSRE